MAKTLNDSLRDEFNEILKLEEAKQAIRADGLDLRIIIKAFDQLLASDKFLSAHQDEIDRTRSEFENYIINTLKSEKH